MEELKIYYIKYKQFVFPILTVVASLIIIVFVIMPELKSYTNIREQINTLQKRTDNLEVKAEELGKIDPDTSQQNIKVAFTILPADQDVPRAMATLQDAINQSGLVLKSTAYSGSGNVAGKSSFLLNVSVLGRLSSVRDFLVKLQETPRLYQVESLAAQFQSTGDVVEASLPIAVFYEQVPGNIGTLDHPAPKLTDSEEQMLANFYRYIPRSYLENELDSSASAVPLGKLDPFE